MFGRLRQDKVLGVLGQPRLQMSEVFLARQDEVA